MSMMECRGASPVEYETIALMDALSYVHGVGPSDLRGQVA